MGFLFYGLIEQHHWLAASCGCVEQPTSQQLASYRCQEHFGTPQRRALLDIADNADVDIA